MVLLNRKIISFKNYDWLLSIIVLVLVAIGLSVIYSIDLSRGDQLTYFSTQAIAVAVGFVGLFIASLVQVSFYRSSARMVYLLALVLLFLVLFLGQAVRGTRGWFHLGSFSFQPVEFAKAAFIIFLAWWIEKYGRRFDRLQFVVSTFLLALFLVVLIMFQPDLGSSLVIFGIWFGLLFLTGTKKRYILGIVGIATLVALIGWFFVFKDYQKQRILIFLNPTQDSLNSGYNVNQSVIAIGSGKFFGQGLGFGSQSQLHFLPEAQTDFIFSVVAEELGFVGVLITLAFYFLLLWRLLKISLKCTNDFDAYLVLGILLYFLIQLLVNIGGASGILPMTGVTLPFLSYGGSSLIISLILVGIAQSVAKSNYFVNLE